MREYVKFKPKDKIRRVVPELGKYLIVFYPGSEYEGKLIPGTRKIVSNCGKYQGVYELDIKEVTITLTY